MKADFNCQECGRGQCKYSTKTARLDKVTRATCLVGEKPRRDESDTIVVQPMNEKMMALLAKNARYGPRA